MEGISKYLDTGRYENCMVLWERGGSTMVLELLPRALEFCGDREQWSSLLRGPPGQLSFRDAVPFATLVDLLVQCTYTHIAQDRSGQQSAQDKMDATYQAIVACIAAVPRVVLYSQWWYRIPIAFERVKVVVVDFPRSVQNLYKGIIRATKLEEHEAMGVPIDIICGVPGWIRELIFRRFVMHQDSVTFRIHYPAQMISPGFDGAVDAEITVTKSSINLEASITRHTKFKIVDTVTGFQRFRRRKKIEEEFVTNRRYRSLATDIDIVIDSIVSITQELLDTQTAKATDLVNYEPVDWQQDLARRLLSFAGDPLTDRGNWNVHSKWNNLSGLA